jgi:hypothetical protein
MFLEDRAFNPDESKRVHLGRQFRSRSRLCLSSASGNEFPCKPTFRGLYTCYVIRGDQSLILGMDGWCQTYFRVIVIPSCRCWNSTFEQVMTASFHILRIVHDLLPTDKPLNERTHTHATIPSACLSVCPYIHPSIYLSTYLSIRLSTYHSIYLSIHPSIPVAPTSSLGHIIIGPQNIVCYRMTTYCFEYPCCK